MTDYKPGDRLKEGTKLFILLSIQQVQQTVEHEIVFPPSSYKGNQQLDTVNFGAKYAHTNFRLLLVKNYIEQAGNSHEHPTTRLVVRKSFGSRNILLLDGHNKH